MHNACIFTNNDELCGDSFVFISVFCLRYSSLEKTTACQSDDTTLPHMAGVSKETDSVLGGMVACMGS